MQLSSSHQLFNLSNVTKMSRVFPACFVDCAREQHGAYGAALEKNLMGQQVARNNIYLLAMNSYANPIPGYSRQRLPIPSPETYNTNFLQPVSRPQKRPWYASWPYPG